MYPKLDWGVVGHSVTTRLAPVVFAVQVTVQIAHRIKPLRSSRPPHFCAYHARTTNAVDV